MGSYDEKAKERIMRYMKKSREEIRLNVPKGTNARYKAFAASQGMSMTKLMTQLMEEEIKRKGFEYTEETKKEESADE